MPNSNYTHLQEKWTEKHRSLQKNLLEKHKGSLEWLSQNSKQAIVSALGGLLLLASPGKHLLPVSHTNGTASGQQLAASLDKSVFLGADLRSTLPEQVQPLTSDQEKQTIDILTRNFGLKIDAIENGIKLERNYGKIGAEQHLARYPGDTMATHFTSDAESGLYWNSGMAPGLGAWGYFSHGATMTHEDVNREKYYVAIQTFLAPGYNENVKKFSDFFRYKKLLVVNPDNGKAIVADIGDAGPATFTGKSLGGSPEVMHYLERFDGAQAGPVVYFFINDPDNKVPLGPINIVK